MHWVSHAFLIKGASRRNSWSRVETEGDEIKCLDGCIE